ncbi:MAG TPA: trypsin-like peptidase domain-containing protein, partial [Gaiellaceae bacterium]
AACRAANVADEALPSVVTVCAAGGQAGGTGSGVVVRPAGYNLTNNHVIAVAAGGGTVSIVRSDGESSDASIVGRDPLTDLAVLRAHDTSSLPVITLGDSGSLRVGEPVVALGSPLGLTSTVTTEIVSALNRYGRAPSENGQAAHLVGAIQTDASINPGNSGGALVDCSARLIGISRPTVGMQVQELSGASPGLFVAAVASGGSRGQGGDPAGRRHRRGRRRAGAKRRSPDRQDAHDVGRRQDSADVPPRRRDAHTVLTLAAGGGG